MNSLVYQLAKFCPYGNPEQSNYIAISKTGFPYFVATSDIVIPTAVATCIAVSYEKDAFITTFSLTPKVIDSDVSWPNVAESMAVLGMQYPQFLNNHTHLLRFALMLATGNVYAVAKDAYSNRTIVIGPDNKLIDLDISYYSRRLASYPIDFL